MQITMDKKSNLEFLHSNKLINYEESFNFMEQRIAKIAKEEESELIWFLEHPAIITAGTSAKEEDILKTDLPIFKTNRGGKHTHHAPGQRVIYIMLNLKKRAKGRLPDLKQFILTLENIIINSLAKIGIKGEIKEGRVGVWVFNENNQKEEKIAAIGVRFTKGVTWHGIAINVTNDLCLFSGINPCGITEYGVCSVHSLKVNKTMKELDKYLIDEFKKNFL